MNIYLDNGYLDMRGIIETGYPFIFIPAARATGKTYGTLKYFTEEHEKIILLRRTQTETDLQNDPQGDGTSFQPVFRDMNIPWHVLKKKNLGYVVNDDPDYAYINGDPAVASINLALSTFANIRGAFDFSYIKRILFDEFIAESHVKKIKNEGMAFANLYESINRNRELKGEDPVQCIFTANAVNMANDIFMYFDIISHAESMLQSGEEVRAVGNKLIVIPQHSSISEKKKKTALYQAVNSEFTDMAVNNKFILNDFTYVRKMPLNEYQCLFQAGDLFVYKHKSRQDFYVTFRKGVTKEIYEANYSGLEKMNRQRWKFPGYYMDGLIFFESYRCIALFEKYFNLS